MDPGLTLPPPAPDDCPVHFLDRDRTVWLLYGGARQPWTAGLLCDTWHYIAPIRAVFTRAMETAIELTELEMADYTFSGGD